MTNKESEKLRERAENWERRCQKYSLQGKQNEAGECRTRALKLWGKAERLEGGAR